MAFSIKDEKTDTLARKVAEMMGDSLTGAVRESLLEKLERLTRSSDEAKALRRQRMEAFLANQKPVKSKDKFDHKKFLDDAWGH